MPDSTPDLEELLARLRAEAARHEEGLPALKEDPRPWSPAVERDAQASAFEQHGWTPLWLATAPQFIALAYQRLLGREPDPAGRDHMLERLRAHTPRTELLAELALSPEALQQPARGRRAHRLAAQALISATRLPVPRSAWLVRGVLRRTEAWLTRRSRRTTAGQLWLAQQRWAQAQTRWGDDLRSRLEASERVLRQELASAQQQLADLHALPAAVRQIQTQTAALHARVQALAPLADAAVQDYLSALEAAFRGPEDALASQLAADYLPALQQARERAGDGVCLDLGCGRGTWLSLLAREGYSARGVDTNAAAIAQAQEAGLDVTCGDALAWLQSQPEGQALAITAFHLMEHLPFALRLALVQECARVLRPGGLLIMETPNPENLWVATHTFHHDPTHSQPLTPDSLAFLAGYCGLEVQQVLRLHPYPPEAALPGDAPVVERLNHMTCGPQDFAVLACRPLAA